MKMKKRVTLCLSIAVFALLFSLIFIKGHHEPKTSNSAASKSEIPTTVSDKMSVNQLANRITQDTKISPKAATDQIKGFYPGSKPKQGVTYRVVTAAVPLWLKYQPQIYFYCQTAENNKKYEISKIIGAYINGEYSGNSKQFSGTLFTNLENSQTIYFELNGDFFDSGSVLPNFGWGSQKEKYFTVNNKISSPANHFGTVDYVHKITM